MTSALDFYDVDSFLSEEERAVRDSVRRWVDERVLPIIGGCYVEGRFPLELVPEMAELGVFGANLPEEYGCAGLNNVAYGLIMQELERGDSGVRSFASVQGALVMYPIYAFGSEAQKEAAIELHMKTHGGRAFLHGHLFGDNVHDFLAPCIYEGEGEMLGMAFFKSLVKQHGRQFRERWFFLVKQQHGGDRGLFLVWRQRQCGRWWHHRRFQQLLFVSGRELGFQHVRDRDPQRGKQRLRGRWKQRRQCSARALSCRVPPHPPSAPALKAAPSRAAAPSLVSTVCMLLQATGPLRRRRYRKAGRAAGLAGQWRDNRWRGRWRGCLRPGRRSWRILHCGPVVAIVDQRR